MVIPLRTIGALSRGNTLYPPRAFFRYKSLTAAIERGRQDGPDRPAGAVERVSPSNLKRRQERLARFGPPRNDDDYVPRVRQERPQLNSTEPSFPPRRRDRDAFSDRDFDRPSSRETRSARFEGRPDRSDDFRSRDRSGFRRDSGEARPERRSTRGSDFGDRPSYMGRTNRQDGRGTSFEGRSFSDHDTTYHRREHSDRQPGSSFSRREDSQISARDRPPTRFSGRASPSDGDRDRSYKTVKEREDAIKSSVRDVETLPYTTAASEFVYGHSSVLAALKANRRKLYNLYVHARGASRDGLMSFIREQKLFPITKEVGDEYIRAMDKASAGRPHNGVILETSQLPLPPITELKSPSLENSAFGVTLDAQSAEDASINGKQEVYEYKSGGWRHPLVLYVDGVLDEGNLGAIARSAYFLNVDAIVTPNRQTAPWSHIAVKASAGAAEALPLFTVREPADFLGKCSRAGWRVYASDSVPAASSITDSTSTPASDDTSQIVYTIARSSKRLPISHSPVAEHPTILMMGAEGTGLRQGLLNLAHYKVGIVHGRDVDEIGVDSLNVSVAASLLCFNMLQKPSKKSAPPAEEILF